MEYRRLGASGFNVPVLSFGTGTFGGKGKLFAAWGATDTAEARRLLDICLDAGVTMFDTADIYSAGESEAHPRRSHEGQARPLARSRPRRRSASARGPTTSAPRASTCSPRVDAQLKRLQTDYIDLFQLHGYDAMTPPEEVLSTLDDARARRQDPLRRRVELLRLAPHEVARASPTNTAIRATSPTRPTTR